MNSLERIQAAVRFQSTDRVPVIGQVFGHAAALAGVPLGDYVQDGELLARCQIEALEQYGYDAVFALMDVAVETEALGSVLSYAPDRYPVVSKYAVETGADLEGLAIPDPQEAGRMPELLRAARILREEVGDEVLVVGCVVGPMTLAVQVMGIERALYLAVDEPQTFERLLDLAADVIVAYGTAQIEAGAHLPVVFNPSASPEVVPPQFFRELELPRLTRVFAAFQKAGALANWLHITGAVEPILGYYPEAGVDIANLDYSVDPAKAKAILPETCLDGNIKPLSFVDEQPSLIEAAAAALIERFDSRGGFILSPGCEIPPEARPENVAALVTAARQHA